MMRFWSPCRLLPAVFTFAAPLAAQTPIPEFNKLRTPTSPAFVVLGTAPTEVQRPNLPSTFALSLLQGVVPGGDAEGVENFAIEVAPYWLVSHPDLTLRRYRQGSWLDALKRTTTFSLATVGIEQEDGGDPAARDVGMGLRSRIWQRSAPPDTSCIARTERTIAAATALSRAIATGVSTAITADPSLASDPARLEVLRGRLYERSLEALPPEQRETLTEQVEECTAALSADRGFVLDAAAAAAWRFPEREVSSGAWRAGAAWVTPAYLGDNFSWVGVARYTWNDEEEGDGLVDLGIRSIYAWDRYGASLEGVFRRPTGLDDAKSLYRLALGFDVLLAENLWLTTAFGRDFSSDDPDSLIALANFQWNVGDRSVRPDIP